ncbi:MAG: hypothetical protein CSA31_00550 [Desulfobulbus propionicus]|nr:MAG: hypothetical protein CSA31_00550 [Desulfobulbus propionicus]
MRHIRKTVTMQGRSIREQIHITGYKSLKRGHTAFHYRINKVSTAQKGCTDNHARPGKSFTGTVTKRKPGTGTPDPANMYRNK